jgi:hypothetical protein
MGEKVLHLELEIADRDIVRFLEQFDGEERRSKALEALKVGVIAIQSASPTLDTRIVEEKFREVQARISTEVEQFREDLRLKLECYFRTD